MVGDLDDHKISPSMPNFSSVQNFRYLCGLEASNSLTGICTEGETFCVLSRVALQLKIMYVCITESYLPWKQKGLCIIK